MNSHLLPLFISYRTSGEKLIKYQANSSCMIMSVILMTTLFYKALILQGEIWCWSALGRTSVKKKIDFTKRMYLFCHPASRAYFCLLDWGGEKEALPESHQTFGVAASRNPGLVNLVFSRQTGFFECKHPFVDKPMVITEPTVASARLLGLGSRLYPSSILRMLNKDLTRLMQSLSRVL